MASTAPALPDAASPQATLPIGAELASSGPSAGIAADWHADSMTSGTRAPILVRHSSGDTGCASPESRSNSR